MPFSKLGLAKGLVEKLKDLNYEKPYPIQQQAIPAVMLGRDVLGIAQTGSGKTASYALPLLSKLKIKADSKNRIVDALILVPTRELAMQVDEVFRSFNSALENPYKINTVYGGVSINPQMKGLFGVNILIATPGRLLELVRANALRLSSINTLIIDEADKMLNLGFKEEMDEIIKLLPQNRQNLLFSATLSEEVKQINQLVLHQPIVIKIKAEEENLDLIDQRAYYILEENKGPLLRHILQEENFSQVLIFTSSKHKADAVALKLRKHKVQATAIHSKKSQGARTAALAKFKDGSLKVLVSTDLLGRGIDVPDLPCVINYELPRSPKDFIHRIGRTGRAETKGKAITFVSEEDEAHFKVIQKKMGKQVETIDGDKIFLV